jgi:hypothetical protein
MQCLPVSDLRYLRTFMNERLYWGLVDGELAKPHADGKAYGAPSEEVGGVMTLVAIR